MKTRITETTSVQVFEITRHNKVIGRVIYEWSIRPYNDNHEYGVRQIRTPEFS